MKKILLVFDGTQFSEGAFEFATRINEGQPIFLTGIFLPQVNYANLWSYASGTGDSAFVPLLEPEDSELVKENMERFESLCRRNNIQFSVHKNFLDFAFPELIKETRFADLVILGSESFYNNAAKGEPAEYLKDVLHTAECPVLVVPEKFDFPKSNVLAYDGSESSVYAIRQFAYLFPELCHNKTLLVTVENVENATIPDENNISELVPGHFPNLEILILKLDPSEHFASWIKEHKSAILISGAFGRSFWSQLYKGSFVSDVIRDHKLPLFITHK